MSVFNNLPVWIVYTILAILVFIFIAIASMAIGRYRTIKYYSGRKQGKFLVFSGISLIIALLFVVPIMHTHRLAKNSGAVYEHYRSEDYGKFKVQAAKSFTAKMPKKNQKGIIIVLYRYGCPTCEEIKQKADQMLPRSNDKIYYVPSRSDLGKQLVKNADVKVVPAIIYVKNNQTAGKYLTSPLNMHQKLDTKTVKYYKRLLKTQY